MNWKQYFELNEKRKQNLKRFLILFLLINLFYARDLILSGPDKVCEDLLTPIEKNVTLWSGDLYDNVSLNNTANTSLIESTENISIGDYLWFKCKFVYEDLELGDKISYIKYRIFFTPIALLADYILAYIVSYLFYLKASRKANRAQPAAKDDKEDKKEDKSK